MRAARVSPPKVVVSDPIEPGPVVAIMKPFALRYCWRVRTSGPLDETVRVRGKDVGVIVGGVAELIGY